jgi:hypothetical protein
MLIYAPEKPQPGQAARKHHDTSDYELGSSQLIKYSILGQSDIQHQPRRGVKLSAIVEGHSVKPRIGVHCDQSKPVFLLHSVSCEIDAQAWLWELWWNLLRWYINRP